MCYVNCLPDSILIRENYQCSFVMKIICIYRGIAIHTVLPASRLPVINETVCPKGQLLLQNFPSIVTGWVVDAKPYEHILDMCAAPGNKTTHLAEMSEDKVSKDLLACSVVHHLIFLNL